MNIDIRCLSLPYGKIERLYWSSRVLLIQSFSYSGIKTIYLRKYDLLLYKETHMKRYNTPTYKFRISPISLIPESYTLKFRTVLKSSPLVQSTLYKKKKKRLFSTVHNVLRFASLVSLFNGMSTFLGYLMPKLFSLKNSRVLFNP